MATTNGNKSATSFFCFFSHSHNLNSLHKKEIGEIYEQVVNLSMQAPSESKDRLVSWLREDVIGTERVMRGSYPSSGLTHTHTKSCFPENRGEQLTDGAALLMCKSWAQTLGKYEWEKKKKKTTTCFNIWVKTTGSQWNGGPRHATPVARQQGAAWPQNKSYPQGRKSIWASVRTAELLS